MFKSQDGVMFSKIQIHVKKARILAGWITKYS